MEITSKQARFIDEYLIDRNGAQAAIRAGYSHKAARETAYRLLTKDHISTRVDEQAKLIADKLEISRESVLKTLLEAIEVARDQGNPAAMISACAQLCKMLGYYASSSKSKDSVNARNGMHNPYEEMTYDELLLVVKDAIPIPTKRI